jgi:hypothetical protein
MSLVCDSGPALYFRSGCIGGQPRCKPIRSRIVLKAVRNVSRAFSSVMNR